MVRIILFAWLWMYAAASVVLMVIEAADGRRGQNLAFYLFEIATVPIALAFALAGVFSEIGYELLGRVEGWLLKPATKSDAVDPSGAIRGNEVRRA